MTACLRLASEADEPAIRAMVRAARLDPTGLRWQHFIVAEVDKQIVGAVQLRPAGRELGSLVVKPDYRHQGIGSRLVERLLEQHKGTVYLECAGHMAPFYRRFGFREIRWWEAPMPLRIKGAIGRTLGSVLGIQVCVMRRP